MFHIRIRRVWVLRGIRTNNGGRHGHRAGVCGGGGGGQVGQVDVQ
jgi:hypothetical protein